MNEQALNELLECSVCLEQLDHTSKVLPCQHTFCKRCLQEIVSTKQELRCPECRLIVDVPVDDLPPNILLVRLLEGLKTQTRTESVAKEASPKRLKKEGSPTAVPNAIGQAVGAGVACAKALFTYDGKDPSDLCFKKGEILCLRRQIDENWFDGELNGRFGFFPVTYVQVITPLPPTIPQCKALYDFDIDDDKEDDCLSFKKEEVLTIIRKVDDNWLEGKKGDKIGIFPISFVQVNEPGQILLRLTSSQSEKAAGNKDPPQTPVHPNRSVKKDDINTAMTTSTSAGHNTALTTDKTQPKRHSLPSVHQDLLLNNVNISSRQSPEIPSTSRDDSVHQDIPNDCSVGPQVKPDPQRKSPPLYMAMYNYKPQRPDEIELRKGDYYCVLEKCQDGWYKGQSMKDGVNGVFPGNYVQSIRTHPSANRSTDAMKGPGAKSKTSSQLGLAEQAPARPSSASMQKSKSSPSRAHNSERSNAMGDVPRPMERGADQAPAPSLRRNSKEASPAPSQGGNSSGAKSSSAITTASLSKASSPILATSKTTRYVRPSKSLSPNTAAMASASGKETSNGFSTTTAGSQGNGSPVWRQARSANAQITPPNVAPGAKGKVDCVPVPGTSSVMQVVGGEKDKKEKKEKEKLGLMKRLTSAGKSKKAKTSESDVSSLSDSYVVHARSASYSNEVRQEPSNVGHKKSGSFDSTYHQPKPSRPKPLVKEKFRCIESYPSQSEIELELKIGDIIYVHKKRDDGWFKGTLKRSGKMGLFPGNFVEPCDQSK